MRIGIAADHDAYDLKMELIDQLRAAGHEVADFGVYAVNRHDDYLDFVIPLARSVALSEAERGVIVCSNTIGASVCANKIPGVRAGAPFDQFSVWQGVEDSHMNLICINTRMVGRSETWDMLQIFLAAEFSQAEPQLRRLGKLASLEHPGSRVRRAH
jgi:ribose 5-phosphate isomerase B